MQTPSYYVLYFYQSILTASLPNPHPPPPPAPAYTPAWVGKAPHAPSQPRSLSRVFPKVELAQPRGLEGGAAWGVAGGLRVNPAAGLTRGSVMGATTPWMDGTREGFSGPQFPALPDGDSPCEDHGGLQRRLGKVPPPRALGKMVAVCLPAFAFAAELGGSGAAPPAPPTSRPRPRRGRAQGGGQLRGKQ